ncbi:MAG: substrate-binding domain-containing protein [Intrasporangium sp.]|uniref:LacI family DNA-binding transcriptional regulator n=1 Tax=Intrasporangium sp. TaxID=1925024 RepID=UPI0026495B1E|nr:substrate-binding domain-containing protein [Intrasporangium sp.]MDN5796529.1 substrate-binding domain-containing protein [Intrasporangium sp.]
MTKREARRRVTINDVARAADVSRQTVSNVVNAPEKVAPTTLGRVQREIDRLGFRPSRAAKTLKQERAGAWGIELNSETFGRFGTILDTFLVELTTRSRRHDAHIVPFTAHHENDPVPAYEDLVASRIADGFVLTDTRHGDPRPAWLRDHAVPYAAFGRIWDDPSITTWVDVDGAAGVSAAVRHLAEQGYERIGWLGWPGDSPVGEDRRLGWARTTADLGLANADWAGSSPQQLERAAPSAAALIDTIGPGGALVCASDGLALGAWQVLLQRGLRLGTDFGLVGFDDTDLAAAIGLTTLRQPLAAVADHVLRMLGTGTTTEADSPAGILLPPELVVRASSTPADDRTTTERGTT